MVSDALAETWFRLSESTPDKRLAQIYLKSALRLAPERVQTLLGDKLREDLTQQIDRRDFASAVTSLSSLLEMYGWEVTLLHLQGLGKESVYLHEKAGDALFHLLGLDFIIGLDVDPLIEFSGITGNDLESLRSAAKECTFHALKQQVEYGNTYYLEAERLKDLPFLLVLPDILNIREQEIHALSDTPSYNEVLRTYYGFTILTSAWDLKRGLKEFTNMCATLGKRIEVRSKRLNIRESMWRHLSPRMQTLMMQTARLSLSQSGVVQGDAIECLSETGDTRALQVLTEANTRVVDWEARRALKKALGKMGGVYQESEGEKKNREISRQIRSTYAPDDDSDDYDDKYYELDEYEGYYDDEW